MCVYVRPANFTTKPRFGVVPFTTSCLKHLFQSEPKFEAINMEIIFILMQIKLIFLKKGFVFRLVLKVRVFGTRKWPVPSAVKLNK